MSATTLKLRSLSCPLVGTNATFSTSSMQFHICMYVCIFAHPITLIAATSTSLLLPSSLTPWPHRNTCKWISVNLLSGIIAFIVMLIPLSIQFHIISFLLRILCKSANGVNFAIKSFSKTLVWRPLSRSVLLHSWLPFCRLPSAFCLLLWVWYIVLVAAAVGWQLHTGTLAAT